MKPLHAPSECPVCGAEVPRGARACPECGADERSGWNEEETLYDGVDLPDGEAPASVPRPSRYRSLFWTGIGILMLLALAWLFMLGRY